MRSPAGLTDHLGYWLRFVSNHVSHSFAQKLQCMDVTVAEWVILRELYDVEALAPSRLADKLDMTRGAITKLADRLIAKSLVHRKDSVADARTHALLLTSSGKRLVPKLAELADQNEAEFFGHMTREERAVLEGVLQDIVRRRGLKTIPVG
jgi:DNA-binding MarR family transcriptional regulator